MKEFFSRIVVVLVCLATLMLSGCDSGSDNSSENGAPRLILSLSDTSVSGGDEVDLYVRLENISDSLFAMSMRIEFANEMVMYVNETASQDPAYFELGEILFVTTSDSLVHISVTRTQGQNGVSGSGAICTIRFLSGPAGIATFEVVPGDLHFYDVTGREIEISELEFESAILTVH